MHYTPIERFKTGGDLSTERGFTLGLFLWWRKLQLVFLLVPRFMLRGFKNLLYVTSGPVLLEITDSYFFSTLYQRSIHKLSNIFRDDVKSTLLRFHSILSYGTIFSGNSDNKKSILQKTWLALWQILKGESFFTEIGLLRRFILLRWLMNYKLSLSSVVDKIKHFRQN